MMGDYREHAEVAGVGPLRKPPTEAEGSPMREGSNLMPEGGGMGDGRWDLGFGIWDLGLPRVKSRGYMYG
jgi:hypothetical protein